MVERTVQMSEWEASTQDYLDDHQKIGMGLGVLIIGAIGYGAYRAGRGVIIGSKKAVGAIKNSDGVQLAWMRAKSWVGRN